jgi:hypothetical protein
MSGDGATITGARVAAAHDGVAELIVELAFVNGGTSEVTLDAWASAALMERCHAGSLDELSGHGWEEVRDALAVSWNRFTDKSG